MCKRDNVRPNAYDRTVILYNQYAMCKYVNIRLSDKVDADYALQDVMRIWNTVKDTVPMKVAIRTSENFTKFVVGCLYLQTDYLVQNDIQLISKNTYLFQSLPVEIDLEKISRKYNRKQVVAGGNLIKRCLRTLTKSQSLRDIRELTRS